METQTHPPDYVTADRLLSFAQAREITGVSRSKIYQLLSNGTFPRPVKIGRNNSFSQREIQQWIARQLDLRDAGSSSCPARALEARAVLKPERRGSNKTHAHSNDCISNSKNAGANNV